MKSIKKKKESVPLKLTFTPYYEDSLEFDRRAKEIQDLVAEIIILGMNEPDDNANENAQDAIRPLCDKTSHNNRRTKN